MEASNPAEMSRFLTNLTQSGYDKRLRPTTDGVLRLFSISSCLQDLFIYVSRVVRLCLCSTRADIADLRPLCNVIQSEVQIPSLSPNWQEHMWKDGFIRMTKSFLTVS